MNGKTKLWIAFLSVVLIFSPLSIAVDFTPNGNINLRGWYSMIQAIDVNATGEMNAATLNTGQGDNELYAMDQDVESTDAVTFLTVDTGQGANELYAMDQDMETTDDITFGSLTLTGFTNGSMIFISEDGKLAQDNSALFWDATDKKFAIGSNAKMRNFFQAVTDDAATDIDATHAVMSLRNIDLTNDNLGIFSFQTYDDSGDTVTSGARLITQFLNHQDNNVSADFSIETTYEGTKAQRLWIKSDGKVGIGTSTPATVLDVNGTLTMGGHAIFEAANLTNTDGKFVGMNISGEDNVGSWAFEGTGTTAYDSSSQGNDGTITGATSTDGKIGRARTFNASQYIDCGAADVLTNQSQFTITYWVFPKTDAMAIGQFHITRHNMSAEATSSYYIYQNWPVGGSTFFYTWNQTGAHASAHFGVLPLNEWSFITVTYDDPVINLYVNAEFKNTDNLSGGMRTTDHPLFFGAASHSTGYTQPLNGTLDEIRFYNRTLSETEMRTLFLLGNPDKSPTGHLMPMTGGTFTGDLAMGGHSITGALDLNATNLDANQTWVHQSYPAACPGSGAITHLGDSVTCSDLWVDEAGDTMTGTLTIDQGSDAKGLHIDSEATTSTNYGLHVDSAGGHRAVRVDQAGDEMPLQIANAGNRRAEIIRSVAGANTGHPVLYLQAANALETAPVLWTDQDGNGTGISVTNEGTGDGIFIDQNGDGYGLHVDSEATTKAALYSFGKYVAQVTQDVSGGWGMWVSRNIDEAGSNPLVNIINDHASDTQGALKVQNDGTGTGMMLDQNGNGIALNIDTEATDVLGDFLLTSQNTGQVVRILPNGVAEAGGHVVEVYSNAVQTLGEVLVNFELENAASTMMLFNLENDGSGTALNIDQNGNGTSIYIDSEATTQPGIEVAMVDTNKVGVNTNGYVLSANTFNQSYIFTHTNSTIPVASAGVWYNVTFEQMAAPEKYGISHTYNDATNDTFTIETTGTYQIYWHVGFLDSAASPSAHVATRLIKNGAEVCGSVFERDTSKQNSVVGIHHGGIASFTAGDTMKVQFTASATTVSLITTGTYGDCPSSSSVMITRID